VYERGTSTAPHRPDRDTDELGEVELAIGGDPILSSVYRRLVAGGWRISRLALMEPYRLNQSQKTITFDARLRDAQIPTTVAKAMRQAYVPEPAMRLLSIHDRVLELLNNRATAGAVLTDLEIMAQTYTWAAWFRSSGGRRTARAPFSDIMADLVQVLSGQRSAGVGLRQMQQLHGFPEDTTYFVGNPFESTGFKPEFRDTSNQVRHTTASLTLYMAVGTYWGVSAAQSREVKGKDFADLRLNEALVPIVRAFASSSLPYPEELGNYIRQILGDPSEVAPWPADSEFGLPDVDD
jgi:hypothetical protein